MLTNLRPRVWILLSVVLYGVAIVLPALNTRQATVAQPNGSIAGYLCLILGWLLLLTIPEHPINLFFALAWVGNIFWVVSLIALARGTRRQTLLFGGMTLALAVLVLIPILTATPIYDGESELIYGFGPGYLFWLGALATPLVAAVLMRRPEIAPTGSAAGAA